MTARRTALQLTALGLTAAILAAISVVWRRDFPVWSDARAITCKQAITLGSAVIWVDARAENEYQQRHWPGAIHLTERAWDAGMERLLTAWQPEQTIVVYCDSGGCRTGHHVAAHLERDLGVQARVLVGGWGVLQQHRAAKP